MALVLAGRACVYVHVCMYIHVCECMCVCVTCVYVYTCACVHECMCACVCVCVPDKTTRRCTGHSAPSIALHRWNKRDRVGVRLGHDQIIYIKELFQPIDWQVLRVYACVCVCVREI